MTMVRRSSVTALLVGISLASCSPTSRREVVDAWLLCDECQGGELATLRDRGQMAWYVPSPNFPWFGEGGRTVGMLAKALRGPARRNVEIKRAQHTTSYAELSAYATSRGQVITTDEANYVARYVGNYIASYQKRAAIALGEIRTVGAVRSLRKALLRDSLGLAGYRADVVSVIHTSLYRATDSVVWTTVSAGDSHTCGSTTSGDAFCWGSDDRGQLGNRLEADSDTAVRVAGDLEVTELNVGGWHSCATTVSGDVYCWGFGSQGQLGHGGMQGISQIPVRVSWSGTMRSVHGGGMHSCGHAFPAVLCWGNNGSGQVGNGTLNNGPVPAPVAGAFSFRSVATGGAHTCADSIGGGPLYCWGDNDRGQLGDGSTTNRPEPVSTNLFVSLLSISAGMEHTCAVAVNGDTFCWGANDFGQLGDDSYVDSPSPTSSTGGNWFVSVSAGSWHTCALESDGAAFCWGANDDGQLGDGSNTTRNGPAPVGGGHRFRSISAGGRHTCGVTLEGDAYCWGLGTSGQLGDGTAGTYNTPVPVNPPSMDPPPGLASSQVP